MTIYDLHLYFKTRMDKIDSHSYPQINHVETDMFINLAVERFVTGRYDGANPRREAFEETEKRADDLRNSIVYTTLTTVANSIFSGSTYASKEYTLPEDYWYLISWNLKITPINCSQVNANIFKIKLDEVDISLRDPYHTPKKEYVLIILNQNKLIVIYDTKSTLGDFIISYIRKPYSLLLVPESTTLPTTFDGRYKLSQWTTLEYFMPSHTHKEIMEIAVNLALETVESPRFQTQTIQLNNQE